MEPGRDRICLSVSLSLSTSVSVSLLPRLPKSSTVIMKQLLLPTVTKTQAGDKELNYRSARVALIIQVTLLRGQRASWL